MLHPLCPSKADPDSSIQLIVDRREMRDKLVQILTMLQRLEDGIGKSGNKCRQKAQILEQTTRLNRGVFFQAIQY